MLNPSCGSSFRATWLFTLVIALLLSTPVAVRAQQHDDDHDHDHLHFSHPLITESPTPDTKIRVDYLYSQFDETPAIRETTIRVEGEYAFSDAFSLAITAPFTFITAPSAARAHGMGNLELSLKAASIHFGEEGILLGGGLSAGIPTGSDSKGIGSSHIIELEPFIDAGYKKEGFELVGFGRVSSTFNRQAEDEAERNLGFDFSALYVVHPRLEALLEFTTERPLVGLQKSFSSFIAPGLKIYPFNNRRLMFGASFALGTGWSARMTRKARSTASRMPTRYRRSCWSGPISNAC